MTKSVGKLEEECQPFGSIEDLSVNASDVVFGQHSLQNRPQAPGARNINIRLRPYQYPDLTIPIGHRRIGNTHRIVGKCAECKNAGNS